MSRFADNNWQFTADDRNAINFQARMNVAEKFRRISAGDKSVITNCIDSHGPTIWGIAKQNTSDIAAAEILTAQIFECIWSSARNFDPNYFSERGFIMLIARHCIREWVAKHSVEEEPAAAVKETETPTPRSVPSSFHLGRLLAFWPIW